MQKGIYHSAMRSAILVILASLSFTGVHAQVKYEREFRVRPKEVPEAALSFLEGIAFDRKVKWFRENSQDGVSFEAKSKLRGQKYSIEFDTLGNLEDIEIDIDEKEIPENTWKQIQEYFDSQFDKTKVDKIQKQWTGDPAVLQEMTRSGREDPDHVVRYEIVVRVVEGQAHNLYELLFSNEGEVLRRDRIVPRPTDNLDF